MFGQHSSYLEHLPSTFAVTSGDDWRVDVEESAFLEKAVSCIGEVVSDSRHCRNKFCAGTQMSDVSQKLYTVLFLSKGVGFSWAITNQFNSMRFGMANL